MLNAINFIWILPILFIIHDLEEVIMMRAWKQRYSERLSKMRRTPFGANNSTAVFACAVLEELLLLVLISLYSIWSGNFSIYFACLFGYTIHLLVHILLTIKFKKYTPGILTVLLQLPLCIYFLTFVSFTTSFLLTSLFATGLIFLNVWLLHQAMGSIGKWLERYANGTEN